MINGDRVLAIIPARGGSKGVPRKNIREVRGKPLIAWTIEQAKESRYIDRLILSSDDPEIIQVARDWGCEAPFVRPAALAQDDTPGIEPVLHAMTHLPGYDWVVLLQATSPLRNVSDIDGCLSRCAESGAPACVTLCEAEQNPWWMYTVTDAGRMQPLLQRQSAYHRRQDLPPVYALNGAVYVAQSAWLQQHKTFVTAETVGYVMPQQRSLDVDTEMDLKMMDMICNEVNNAAHQ